MLLAWHVVGVGSPSLLVVVRVGTRIVEGVNALIVIWVVSRWRYGPVHVCLVVVWMWRVPHAIWTHSSIYLALGVRGHGWIVTMWWPSLRMHTHIITHKLGLMVIGAKSLVFIDNIGLPRCHHSVLWRNGSAVRVRPTSRLTRSLITMVCWARLGGQQWGRMTGWQRGERGWLWRSRLSSLSCTLWRPMYGAVLCRALWRDALGCMMRR